MTSKINIFKKIWSVPFLVFSLFLATSTHISASEPNEEQILVPEADGVHVVDPHAKNADEEVDITAVAFEHILDSHSWHFWGEAERFFTRVDTDNVPSNELKKD